MKFGLFVVHSILDKMAEKLREKLGEFLLHQFGCPGGHILHFVDPVVGEVFAHNQHLNFLRDVYFYRVAWVEDLLFLLHLDRVAVHLYFHRHQCRLSFQVDELIFIMFLEPESLLDVIDFCLKGHEHLVNLLLEKRLFPSENPAFVR